MAHKVYVIVDRDFGERLTGIPASTPVWIVDSPPSSPVIRRLWNENPVHDHLKGITSFSDLQPSSPEELFLMELETIDLHHGIYSVDPPYSTIEAVGTALTDRILKALREYGFGKCTTTARGFIAERDLGTIVDG